MFNPEILPTRQLVKLIEGMGGLDAAAVRWGFHDVSLRRFMAGKGNLSAGTQAKIMEATGLTYEELFKHRESKQEAGR